MLEASHWSGNAVKLVLVREMLQDLSAAQFAIVKMHGQFPKQRHMRGKMPATTAAAIHTSVHQHHSIHITDDW